MKALPNKFESALNMLTYSRGGGVSTVPGNTP
jgi:hypothetical protein